MADTLGTVYSRLKSELKDQTPALTKLLAPGLAMAEGPGSGESFGMSRSRLIAQAIWDAYVRGQQSEEARMAELAIQLERIGLSLDRPHLRAGSADVYALDLLDLGEAAA